MSGMLSSGVDRITVLCVQEDLDRMAEEVGQYGADVEVYCGPCALKHRAERIEIERGRYVLVLHRDGPGEDDTLHVRELPTMQ